MMVVAFLSAAGLLYWLSIKAAPVEVEVVEGTPIVDMNASTRVAADVFGSNPMAQADILIEVRGLPVEGPVGSQAFFLQVPTQGSYLVRMLPEALTDEPEIEFGAVLAVTGRVYEMSDSVADSWVASGAISEGDRILAIFAETFLEVERVTVLAPPPPDEN
jgi:hypothetical protein